jgi:hypothetical protein
LVVQSVSPEVSAQVGDTLTKTLGDYAFECGHHEQDDVESTVPFKPRPTADKITNNDYSSFGYEPTQSRETDLGFEMMQSIPAHDAVEQVVGKRHPGDLCHHKHHIGDALVTLRPLRTNELFKRDIHAHDTSGRL